jgi:hypothetical protein
MATLFQSGWVRTKCAKASKSTISPHMTYSTSSMSACRVPVVTFDAFRSVDDPDDGEEAASENCSVTVAEYVRDI